MPVISLLGAVLVVLNLVSVISIGWFWPIALLVAPLIFVVGIFLLACIGITLGSRK